MKTPDQNVKLGTVVVLDSLSSLLILDFKRSRVRSQSKFKLLAPLDICGMDAATKFKFCAQIQYG